MYYKRWELQWRFNLFFTGSILSGAWAGVSMLVIFFKKVPDCHQLLAYALGNMAGVCGYNGWRWIFIIEGLLTVAISILAKFVIVDWPQDAKFLTIEEHSLLLARLYEDHGDAKMDRYDGKAARRLWCDWKMYIGLVLVTD